MRKPFSRNLYGKYDFKAKSIVMMFLQNRGYWAEFNRDQYGVDLCLEFGVEVEVKRGWKNKEFPFSDLHIPRRKEKFCTPWTWFAVLNESMTRIALVHSKWAKETRAVPNIYVPDGSEDFLVVPLKYVKFYDVGG